MQLTRLRRASQPVSIAKQHNYRQSADFMLALPTVSLYRQVYLFYRIEKKCQIRFYPSPSRDSYNRVGGAI